MNATIAHIDYRMRYTSVVMNVTDTQSHPTRQLPGPPKELLSSDVFLLKRLGFAAKERAMASYEETGLQTEVRRFLARITYHSVDAPAGTPLFHTFAFLLDETGGTLGAIDTTEQIEDWREIEVAELPRVASFLNDLRTAGTLDIGGDWRAWGKFRAVVHRAVAEALAS